MNSKTVFLILVVFAALFTGCQPAPPPEATATAIATATIPEQATDTPIPTNTVLPTETPKPTNTPLPQVILFRDDFNGEFQPGWEWENENPSKWTFTDDGWLQIIGEHDSLLSEDRQANLLWYPLPTGDFVITVHLTTKPFENFHQAAIFIYEDPENYITINRGYCDVCPTGGNGIYMDYKISGQWGGYRTATQAEEVYLRLESKADTISGYYALSPDQWERLGRFGNYFEFSRVGIGVSNVRAAGDVVGLFDYFEIALP